MIKSSSWLGMYQITGIAPGRGERSDGGDKNQKLIRLGSYNIRNGRNGGMDSALRGTDQANMDLGALQETNVMEGAYTHGSYVYSVIEIDTQSRNHSGVAVFYRALP